MARKSMQAQLIAGEALINQASQPTWAATLQSTITESMKAARAQQEKVQSAKKAINNKVGSYIDQLNSTVDLEDLNPVQKSTVTNFLVENRNNYAAYANEIARIEDPSNPRYLELRDKINGIQLSFQNLADQLGSYKKDKAAYLRDFDNSAISDGNEIGPLADAARIYTEGTDLGISEGGGLQFYDFDKAEYTSYSDIKKPFLKDFKAADDLLNLNETIYSAGHALAGARKNMIRQKVSNLISSGGRDTLLSLASDDFIIEGGLGISDPALFLPENEDLLKQAVLDSYMDVLSDTAAQGARDKRPANSPGTGGFTGALKDEINLSLGTIVPNAMQFSQYSLATPEQRPQAVKEMLISINSIDPTSSTKYRTREDFYNEYLEGMGMKDGAEAQQAFINEYGDYAVYQYNTRNPELSKPLALDVTDAAQLYAFYLKNAGLSTKATNYHLGQYENYLNQLKKNTPSESNTSGGGAYDNL